MCNMKISAYPSLTLLATIGLLLLTPVWVIPRADPLNQRSSTNIRCSQVDTMALFTDFQEMEHFQFLEDNDPGSGSYYNYVCMADFLTKKTEFNEILTNRVRRIYIICNKKSKVTSSLRVGSLKQFRNLIDLRFRDCKFDENVNIGEYLDGIFVRHLKFKNSYRVTNASEAGVMLPQNFYNNPKLDATVISHNHLTRLPTSLLCQWTSLTVLLLSYNNISNLMFLYQQCNDNTWHKPLQQLVVLDVSHNKLTSVSQQLLISFPALRSVYLNNNKIHSIMLDAKSFQSPPIPPIRVLELSFNKLRNFTACRLLPYLHRLNLHGNNITCDSDSLQLEDCQSLQNIHVDGKTAQPCDAVMASLAALVKLLAISFQDIYLRAVDFSNVPKSLLIFHASHSHLETLTDINNVSSELSLEQLRLPRNKLTELGIISFPPQLITISLEHNKITHINNRVFSQCNKLSYIALNDNKLTDISSLFAQLPKLIMLNLQNNNILIFDYAMIPFNLLYLSVSHNKIMEITDNNQRLNQIQLQFLNLSNNHFITLSKDSFAPSLFTIDLSNCVSDSMLHDVFQNVAMKSCFILKNMTVHNAPNPYVKMDERRIFRDFDLYRDVSCLNMEYFCSCNECSQRSTNQSSTELCCNTYKSSRIYEYYFYSYALCSQSRSHQHVICFVEISCFNLCRRVQFSDANRYQPLKKLHCGHTQNFYLMYVQRSVFYRHEHFLNQRGLMLSNMTITQLNDSAFSDFKQLVILNLDNNFLTQIHGREFENLGNLTKLYLNENRLSKICDFSFKDLQSLSFLEMKGNRLRLIREKTFAGLRSLQRLYLTDNHLNLTEAHIFANLRALDQLHLGDNEIPKIHRFTFTGLTKLRKLHLNKNRISIIENFSFDTLHQLQILNLDDNRISTITNATFYGLINLAVLNLHGNQIASVNDDSFFHLLSLNFLFLHNNQLNYWSVNLPIKLVNLTLRQNQFPCDCKSVFHLQKELAIISKTVSTDADQNRCVVQNSYLPHISINDMSNEDCYNANVIVYNKTRTEQLLAVSLGPASVLMLLLCLVVVLYLYRLEMQVLLYSKFKVHFWRQDKGKDVAKAYDAFLSYSNDDRLFIAEKLLPKLEEKFSVCVHERDFPVGAYIAETISDVVENSCRTLVILSPSFAKSGWCMLEFKCAHYQTIHDQYCRLIVIVIEDVDKKDLSSELRAYMRTHTFLRWEDPLFWEKLMYAMPHRDQLVRRKFSYQALVETTV